jgi:hypothetical protein
MVKDKELENHLHQLILHSDTELLRIPENKQLRKNYSYILENIINEKKQPVIKKIIKKSFRPTEIYPNTIGSFIYGCKQEDYGDIDKYCSVLCLDSWNNPGKIRCKDNVAVQVNNHSEDRFIFRNLVEDSDRCFVYIKDDFDSFYEYEIEKLRTHQIKYIQLLSTRTSKHFKMSEMIPLEDAPCYRVHKKEKDWPISDESFTWVAIFLSIIIVFIALLFIFVRSRIL